MSRQFATMYVSVVDGRDYQKMMKFESREESTDCFEQLELLKNLSSSNNGRGIPEPEYRRLAAVWLVKAYQFAERWTNERVPLDVRRAVHSTEDYLEREHRNFGDDVGAFHM